MPRIAKSDWVKAYKVLKLGNLSHAEGMTIDDLRNAIYSAAKPNTTKQISSIKSLMSSAMDRNKRIEAVVDRLVDFINYTDLTDIFFGKYSLEDKNGYFRGADGSSFFAEYVKKSRNPMNTCKDLENIMVKYVESYEKAKSVRSMKPKKAAADSGKGTKQPKLKKLKPAASMPKSKTWTWYGVADLPPVGNFWKMPLDGKRFWEMSLDGNSLTRRWGKVGGTEQTKTHKYKSYEEALKDARKLVARKQEKYTAVGGGWSQ